ncbi:MAG TPA: MMPL family transporter [Bacilli bacterium]
MNNVKESADKGLLWQWGQGVYRFRWMILILWAVLFMGFGILSQQTAGLLKDNGYTPYGSESERGLEQLRSKLQLPTSTMELVYKSNHLDLTSDSAKQDILSSLQNIKKLPFVKDFQFNPSQRIQENQAEHKFIQSIIISLDLSTDEALAFYPDIKRLIRAPEGMTVYITGGTAVLYDMAAASKKDIVKAEIIGLPIALIVLLLVFGTVLGALLPMIVGVLSVTVSLGITYFIAQSYSLSAFLPSIVTMLGLAVGIDYALFMVSRFREELKRQPLLADAVAMTCQTAGKAIMFSGMAVIIGLLGMLFIDLNIFRSLCLGGFLVVSASVLVANTLLLALLGIFGHKINIMNILPASLKKRVPSGFWHRVAYLVMRRPLAIVLTAGTILVLFMLPLFGIQLGIPNAEVLPPSYESRMGADLLNASYDKREMNPIQLTVETKEDVWDESSVQEIKLYMDRIALLDGVRGIQSYLNISDPVEQQRWAKGHTALIVVIPQWDPDDQKTDGLVKRLRELEDRSLNVLVTGATAYRVDIVERINERIPELLLFVMGVTFIVLFFAFRSVVLPLKAVLMNVLSLGASLGIVVIVFQQGYLAEWLHITSTGYINASSPVIIFCVVFGISMDYEVFLISRIMEQYEASGDNERSTAEGLTKTGSIITSAALILVAVVGSFIFADIEFMKSLGLGLALAVIIDATIIRIVMVPALMKLLGRANWWAPGWLR